MNFKYLNPTLLGSHGATLVIVFAQLLGKDSLSSVAVWSVIFIGAALPFMALAFVLDPWKIIKDHTSEKLYLVV